MAAATKTKPAAKQPVKQPWGRPFQPGQSGNPHGRPPTGKTMTDAIRAALEQVDSKSGKLKSVLVADKLVELSLEGNVVAIKEVNDRLEGKPVQPVLDETPKQNLFEGWPEEQVRAFGEMMEIFRDRPQDFQLLLAQLRLEANQEAKV